MKKWVVSYIIALAVQLSVCPAEEPIHEFRAVDPILLEKKVPAGYGQVFVQAGRQNNINPIVLAAISAHESGGWESRIARKKKNWMGLMTRRGPKSFGTPKESIFYAAQLLNQKPFKDRDTLSQIAPIYCASRSGHWKASVLKWEQELREWQAADAGSDGR
jgi:Mannosyl-glycoprotein endo-beta-N-acetylglucosaminidase